MQTRRGVGTPHVVVGGLSVGPKISSRHWLGLDETPVATFVLNAVVAER